MQGTDQLTMDRPAHVLVAARPDQLKSILFHVDEDDGLEDRLQAALSLARACSAHMELIQVIPAEAYTIVDAYASYVSPQIVQGLEEDAARVRNRLEDRLGREDVSWSFQVVHSSFVPALIQNAALADLLFVNRQSSTYEFGRSTLSLLGEMVCRARTPICLPGDRAAELDPCGTAVIAWNGSIEAANAVRGSIGMLRLASQVRVIRFTEDKDSTFPDTRLVEYLSRHGISAELDVRAVTNGFADDLVEYARVFRGQYVVMGGYSHSRAGEFLFGGVTRALLLACPVTLVLAH